MMQVDGVPNVRVCSEPVREGAKVNPQNVRGSLERDLMAATDHFGGRFTPVGFYYRVMHRPRWIWPYAERFLRSVAGLGSIDKHAKRVNRYDTEHIRTQVLVIGGGRSGRDAARQHASGGAKVVLVDENPGLEPGEGYEVISPGRAVGLYEGGLVPVDAGHVLYRIRAEKIVVATGTLEQPLVFPGNDLVGVMPPGGVERLVESWSLKPGNRAVVIAGDDRSLAVADTLRDTGVDVVETIDLRTSNPGRIAAKGSKGVLRSVEIDGRAIDCDLLVQCGGRQPAYSLLSQAGATVEYDPATGVFVPRNLPANVEAVGSVTGVSNVAVPKPTYHHASETAKCFVCHCEDVTEKDLKRAIAEGFDSIELAKRYTTVTMGPCQGKLCHLNSIRLYAKENGTDEAAIGTTTARPMWAPVTMGLVAGRPHEPEKLTSIHHRHAEMGGDIIWTGAWKRPHSYGDAPAEAMAVHDSLGIIDVSTLGKLLVKGPDAAAFLERLYPSRYGDLKPGRIRYALLGTDAGRIMDDGTVAYLGNDTYYVTTTSTGAGAVVEWFEWWNAVWHMDVEIVNLTGAIAAVNVAGPNARAVMEKLTDLDVSADGFKYLDAKEALVAGVPCLILRIGFVGELGYEIHFPSPYGEYFWDTLLAQGAEFEVRPFALEAQRILRLEKMHIIVGQDTDSESNALEANMPWAVKFEKDDFVGKWSLEHVLERGFREQLVGFEMQNGVVPAEGGQIVMNGKSAGRVTSARFSQQVGKSIGLAWVPPSKAEDGAEIEIRVNGRLEKATVRTSPFFDPEGSHLRS
jgi:sarcosine oxidase subunit alpha